MKRLLGFRIFAFSFWGMATVVSAQEFYIPLPQSLVYEPTQGEDLHLFNLNPASQATAGYRGSLWGFRQFHKTKFVDNDDSRTETTASNKIEQYGGALLTDLGAGMAVGVNIDRVYTRSDVTRSTANGVASDYMVQQSVQGRVLIELASGLRAGFFIRYVSLKGDLAGAFSAGERYRVRYHGNMIGHGAGAVFAPNNWFLGFTYIPPIRGKSEILYEERIIADPGYALLATGYKFGMHTLALGLQRWVHRRDERTATVPSEDGQRTLVLNGLDPEKNAFPVAAYHLNLELGITQGQWIRAGVARKDTVYVTDATSTPTNTSDYDSMSALEYHLSVRLVRGNFDVEVGAVRYGRSKTLTRASGQNGATYEGSGNALFVSLGAKL